MDRPTPSPDEDLASSLSGTEVNQEAPNNTARRISSSGDGLAERIDRHAAIKREERQLSAKRLRAALLIATVVWPLFIITDWLIVTWIQPGPLLPFVALRMGGWALALPLYFYLITVKEPSWLVIRAIDFTIFGLGAVLLSVMSMLFLGIESPYATGVLLVMVVRIATMAEPWQRGLLHYGFLATAFPLTSIVAAIFDPEIARQFQDERARSMFAVHVVFQQTAAAIGVVAGHTIWKLRHATFELHTIDRYQLIRRIGKGGMGEVWVARHEGLRKEVALKLLKPKGEVTERMVARFEREVRATAQLSHPNTIRVDDYGVSAEGVWYYAMELLEGKNLRELIEYERRLELDRAVHIINQVCKSLGEAHHRGIIHRDIKPENIFITTMGELEDFAKVLDFGIARIVGEEGPNITRENATPGTPHYMAPEVAQSQPADARSDVYSIGAVLFHAITGEPPFTGSTKLSVLLKHTKEPVPSPSSVLGRPLPDDVESLILKCLRKNPADRFDDAYELSVALEDCSLEPWRPSPIPFERDDAGTR